MSGSRLVRVPEPGAVQWRLRGSSRNHRFPLYPLRVLEKGYETLLNFRPNSESSSRPRYNKAISTREEPIMFSPRVKVTPHVWGSQFGFQLNSLGWVVFVFGAFGLC